MPALAPWWHNKRTRRSGLVRWNRMGAGQWAAPVVGGLVFPLVEFFLGPARKCPTVRGICPTSGRPNP